MKSCLICKLSDQDDAVPTCPACGEASWSPDNATPQTDEIVITDDASADVEKTKGKRLKKQ